jgi:hypothetical protein
MSKAFDYERHRKPHEPTLSTEEVEALRARNQQRIADYEERKARMEAKLDRARRQRAAAAKDEQEGVVNVTPKKVAAHEPEDTGGVSIVDKMRKAGLI